MSLLNDLGGYLGLETAPGWMCLLNINGAVDSSSVTLLYEKTF